MKNTKKFFESKELAIGITIIATILGVYTAYVAIKILQLMAYSIVRALLLAQDNITPVKKVLAASLQSQLLLFVGILSIAVLWLVIKLALAIIEIQEKAIKKYPWRWWCNAKNRRSSNKTVKAKKTKKKKTITRHKNTTSTSRTRKRRT